MNLKKGNKIILPSTLFFLVVGVYRWTATTDEKRLLTSACHHAGFSSKIKVVSSFQRSCRSTGLRPISRTNGKRKTVSHNAKKRTDNFSVDNSSITLQL